MRYWAVALPFKAHRTFQDCNGQSPASNRDSIQAQAARRAAFMQKADRDNRFFPGDSRGWWRLTLRVASCTLSQLCVPGNFVL